MANVDSLWHTRADLLASGRNVSVSWALFGISMETAV